VGEFRFQVRDPLLELLDQRGDLPLRKSLVDMLRAVHVPRFELKQNGSFHFAGVRGIAEPFFQRRIAFDDRRLAPEFHALAVRVVHQEDEGLRVFRQIAERNVLAVAAEVGEAERLLVDDAEKAR